MQVPRVRFTIRGMILVVAIVAILIPFPSLAVSIAALSLFYYAFPIVVVAEIEKARGRRGGGIASVSIAMAVTSLGVGRLDGLSVMDGALLCATVPHLAGPLYVASGLCRGRRLFSGEILWAWIGLAWTVMIYTPVFIHHMRQSPGVTLELMAQLARATLGLALWLMFHGKRPARDDPSWGHYLGWALVEGDILICAWIASFG